MLRKHIARALAGLSEHTENPLYTDDGEPKISVNALTGHASALYEKLRYLIDYRDEHVLRRNAIERIIKRKLTIEHDTAGVGDALLRELVGGGYLPNNQVSESATIAVQHIVDKYVRISNATRLGLTKASKLAANEIERLIAPRLTDDLLAECFFRTMSEHVRYLGNIDRGVIELQTYIAARRMLLRDDHDALVYAVLTHHIPRLAQPLSEEETAALAPDVAQAYRAAEEAIRNPLNWRIAARLGNHAVYFAVIREIVLKYGAMSEAIFNDRERLAAEITDIVKEKNDAQYEAASRGGTRAVMYILLTKTVLAFLIELPYERFVLNSVQYTALATNVVFHPLLLLLMTKTIKKPSPKNTDAIIAGVAAMVHDDHTIERIHIRATHTSAPLMALFGLLYAMLFAASFGVILWILLALHFNAVSIALFLFFLTLVSYFGFRIRYLACRWRVRTEPESVRALLWHFFTMPIIRTGRWMSEHFSSINVFILFMDFVIETPFKMILSTFDAFVSFLKDQRADVY